ncbi:MAG: hypothetical protein COB43_00940 [Oceanospirillales bacterium]|nr:MAG: hypothetical protein COB43_00940 [Oceanospirillales bacterium]
MNGRRYSLNCRRYSWNCRRYSLNCRRYSGSEASSADNRDYEQKTFIESLLHKKRSLSRSYRYTTSGIPLPLPPYLFLL